MDRYSFTTTITTSDDLDYDIRVTYRATKGYADTWEEPGSPDEIEIVSIVCGDPSFVVPDALYEDDGLLLECAEDWAGEIEAAKEWRAQCRRDDAMMGWD